MTSTSSVTRLMGRHTAKFGAFWNYALKSQSSRAPANGLVSFQNDASNPFETGYPVRQCRARRLPVVHAGGRLGDG